ncbi:MAG: hypothetical protein LBL13_05665 [Bacteroidales bacterium]|jgi:hypothetical protein|nr:hypothetical protein [Bacteroidales bacterium]
MTCKQCGQILDADAKFCPNCGKKTKLVKSTGNSVENHISGYYTVDKFLESQDPLNEITLLLHILINRNVIAKEVINFIMMPSNAFGLFSDDVSLYIYSIYNKIFRSDDYFDEKYKISFKGEISEIYKNSETKLFIETMYKTIFYCLGFRIKHILYNRTGKKENRSTSLKTIVEYIQDPGKKNYESKKLSNETTELFQYITQNLSDNASGKILSNIVNSIFGDTLGNNSIDFVKNVEEKYDRKIDYAVENYLTNLFAIMNFDTVLQPIVEKIIWINNKHDIELEAEYFLGSRRFIYSIGDYQNKLFHGKEIFFSENEIILSDMNYEDNFDGIKDHNLFATFGFSLEKILNAVGFEYEGSQVRAAEGGYVFDISAQYTNVSDAQKASTNDLIKASRNVKAKSESNEKSKNNTRKVSMATIFGLTPKTNCKECGCPSCMIFAREVLYGNISIDDCPYIRQM